jgi:hypothetical protein
MADRDTAAALADAEVTLATIRDWAQHMRPVTAPGVRISPHSEQRRRTKGAGRMSAQIIAALRKRAGKLEGEAANPALAYTIDEHGVAKDPASLRWLAAEFRALADEAESR